MLTQDAIKHFSKASGKGGKAAIAKALKINNSAVTAWGDVVPKLRAYELQELSGGAVKVDLKLYEEKQNA